MLLKQDDMFVVCLKCFLIIVITTTNISNSKYYFEFNVVS